MNIKAGRFLSGAEFCGRCSSIAAALRHRETFLVLLWIFHTAVRSWALSERKGTIINCALLRRPTSHCSTSVSTYISLRPCLSILTHTVSFFFFFFLSQRPSLDSLSLLPPSPFFPVGAVMGLKDVCDVIQTDCSCVSGMPLPPLLPAAPSHLHPPPSCSQTQGGISSVCLWLCCAGVSPFNRTYLPVFPRPGSFDTDLTFAE